MKFSTQIKPISYVKANAAELLERIAKERVPIIITQNGEARAVLMDIRSYEEQLETLSLLNEFTSKRKEVQGEEIYSLDEAVAELRRRRSGPVPGAETVARKSRF